MSDASSPTSPTSPSLYARIVEKLGGRDGAVLQFLKFGIVGGSGVFVNFAVLIIVRRFFGDVLSILPDDPFLNLLGSRFHIRWYHIFLTIAFVVANTWNYQLNRWWTFKGSFKPRWWRGYIAFLMTGVGALVVNLLVATSLMNANSPISLPTDIFDDSTGLRTRLYWANLIGTLVSMPVNFILNKIWAFRKPKKTTVVEDAEPV